MPKLRKVSGDTVVRILCNKMGFEISGRSGSHIRLSKLTPEGSTVVPMHKELKIGTLRGVKKVKKNGLDAIRTHDLRLVKAVS